MTWHVEYGGEDVARAGWGPAPDAGGTMALSTSSSAGPSAAVGRKNMVLALSPRPPGPVAIVTVWDDVRDGDGVQGGR